MEPSDADTTQRDDEFVEIVRALERTPERLARATRGLTNELVRTAPNATDFSIVANIAHLLDLECEASTPRIRRMLAEHEPALDSFDGTAVAEASDYASEPFEATLEQFRLARERNVRRLRAAGPLRFHAPVSFGGQPQTMRDVLVMLRDHDDEHVRAVEMLAAAHRGEAGAGRLGPRDRAPSLV